MPEQSDPWPTSSSSSTPPEDDAGPTARRLYREPDGKRMAGVCAGLADYTGIDPRVLRAGVIVLAVLSPVTVIAYGLAALLLSERPEGVARHRAPAVGSGDQHLWLVVALVIGLAVGVGIGTWTWWQFDERLAALALIALGVAWLFRGRTGAASALSVDTTTESDQSVHWSDRVRDERLDSIPDPEHTDAPRPAAEGAGPPGGDPPLPPPGRSGPLGSTRRRQFGRWLWRRRPGSLGMLLVALLLIGWGTVQLLRVLEVVRVDTQLGAATALLVAGATLVLAAWWGRAGLLVPVGIAIIGVLAASEALDISLDAGTGERTVVIDRPSQLDERHELMIGQLTLDLRDAPLPSRGTTSLSAGVGIGQLRVRLPADANVVIHSDVRMGSLMGDLASTPESGILLRSTERVAGEPSGPRLDLRLDVGIGEVVVTQDEVVAAGD